MWQIEKNNTTFYFEFHHVQKFTRCPKFYWKYEIFKIYMKKPVGITIHVQKNTKFNCKNFTKIKNKGKWKFYKVNIFER